MLNENQVKAKWHDIKGGIRNMWGKITEEELDHIAGDLHKLEELVQSKYYDTPENIQEDLNRVLSSFDNESDLADHDTNTSSYMRKPEGEVDQVRTSGKSQVQDKVQEIKTRSHEREIFEKKSDSELSH